MAAGDLTASTPVFAITETEIKTAVDALNLAAATDFIIITPRNNGHLVFKVERAAA